MSAYRDFLIVIAVVLAPGTLSSAQDKYPGVGSEPALRNRQWYREMAVIHAGNTGRQFVETVEEASGALLACTPPMAAVLVRFYESGQLGKLTRPHDFLRAIRESNCGDEIVRYAILHLQELADPDYFNLFMRSPAEYALDLKSLPEETAMLRNGHTQPPGVLQTRSWDGKRTGEWRAAALLLGVTIVAVLIVRWLRSQREEWFT